MEDDEPVGDSTDVPVETSIDDGKSKDSVSEKIDLLLSKIDELIRTDKSVHSEKEVTIEPPAKEETPTKEEVPTPKRRRAWWGD